MRFDSYEVQTLTDVGQVRTRNEDNALTLTWRLHGEQSGGPVLLAAVADGMGGHANGQIASKMALRALASSVVHSIAHAPLEGVEMLTDDQVAHMLVQAVDAATNQLNQAASHGLQDMGSTLCVALFLADRCYIANVGDSRAYLLAEGVRQITTDHSLVQQLLDKGELTPEEACVHPRRNEIYRMIGLGRSSQPDLFTLDLQPGDVVLLCSDGLTNLVENAELGTHFAPGTDLGTAVQAVVALANHRGGDDNITVVAVRYQPLEAGDM